MEFETSLNVYITVEVHFQAVTWNSHTPKFAAICIQDIQCHNQLTCMWFVFVYVTMFGHTYFGHRWPVTNIALQFSRWLQAVLRHVFRKSFTAGRSIIAYVWAFWAIKVLLVVLISCRLSSVKETPSDKYSRTQSYYHQALKYIDYLSNSLQNIPSANATYLFSSDAIATSSSWLASITSAIVAGYPVFKPVYFPGFCIHDVVQERVLQFPIIIWQRWQMFMNLWSNH